MRVQWRKQAHDVTQTLAPSDLVLGDLWLALASRLVPNFLAHARGAPNTIDPHGAKEKVSPTRLRSRRFVASTESFAHRTACELPIEVEGPSHGQPASYQQARLARDVSWAETTWEIPSQM